MKNFFVKALANVTLWEGEFYGLLDTDKKRYALLTKKPMKVGKISTGQDDQGKSITLEKRLESTFLKDTIKSLEAKANVLIQGESAKDSKDNFGIINFEVNQGISTDSFDGIDAQDFKINSAKITFAYWGDNYKNSDKIFEELPKALSEVENEKRIESQTEKIEMK